MRKFMFAAVGLAALAAASVAVAEGIDGAKTAKAVAGTFSATSANVSTRSCTTTDGKTLTITNGRYTGVASGDPDLTGPIDAARTQRHQQRRRRHRRRRAQDRRGFGA